MIQMFQGMPFRISGKIRCLKPDRFYFVCRCYLLISTSLTDQTAYKTFGNDVMGMLSAVYSGDDDFKPELIKVAGTIWAVSTMPKQHLVNLRTLLREMNLRLMKGCPPLFALGGRDFNPLDMETTGVYFMDGDMKKLEEMKSTIK